MVAALNGTVVVPKLGNLELLRASDVGQLWGLNILLYGQAGVGKTTLAASAADSPHGKDVLFVDIEGGTLSISDRADVHVYRPTTWTDIQAIYEAVAAGGHAYKTIVIDSLSEAQVLALKAVAGAKGTELITQQDWGKTNERLLGMVRAWRGLTHRLGVNTIFTALERETKDDQSGVVKVGPALTPGSVLNVTAAVDSVGYLTKDLKTGKRLLHLEGGPRFIAKVRQPLGDRRLPPVFEEPSMVAILAALRGSRKEATPS